mgnify:CR=1 FL=1
MKRFLRIPLLFKLFVSALIIIIFFAMPVYKIYKLISDLSFGKATNKNIEISIDEVITNLDKALQEFLKD